MPPDLLIRPMTESDLRAYIPLRLEALRDHPAAFGTSYEDQRDDPDEAWLTRLRPALEGVASRLFLAQDPATQELAGLLGVFRETGSKSRHSATLYSVYLRPPYRGTRTIDRLLEAALDWCRAQHVTILRLTVTTTNLPAIRCYQRLGFQITGTMPQVIRTPDGVHHDEYLMSRQV